MKTGRVVHRVVDVLDGIKFDMDYLDGQHEREWQLFLASGPESVTPVGEWLEFQSWRDNNGSHPISPLSNRTYVPEIDKKQGDLTLNHLASDDYKGYSGKAIEQMPLLLEERRRPLSTSELMQILSDVYWLYHTVKRNPDLFSERYKSSIARLYQSGWGRNITTGDKFLYHPDKKVKIALMGGLNGDGDSVDTLLREINPQSKLKDGFLVLPDGLYEKVGGLELTEEQVEDYKDRLFFRRGSKKDPVMQFLARQQEILNPFVNALFAQSKGIFWFNRNGGIKFNSYQDEPTMHLVAFGPYINNALDDSHSLIIGVPVKSANTPKALESVLIES